MATAEQGPDGHKQPGAEVVKAQVKIASQAPLLPPHQRHCGDPVRVGPYTVLAGGTRDLISADLEKADVLVPLTGSVPFGFGRRYEVLAAPMQDFGGVPIGWQEFLEGEILPELASGRRLLVFCMGSHGRTGTFLASLIALLESAEETPDPIAAVRERHCDEAVETLKQAEAIFAIRGEPLPAQYKKEFAPRTLLGLTSCFLGKGPSNPSSGKPVGIKVTSYKVDSD